MNIELAKLLKESLLLAGCSAEIMKDFDDNSTIALEFNDQPELYLFLDRNKNRVIAWSPICDVNSSIIDMSGGQLFRVLLQEVHYSDSGYHNICIINDKLCVQCVFDNASLTEPELFLDGLSGYFNFIAECIEIIK